MVQSDTDNTLESFNNFGLQLDTARSSWSSRWSEAVCRGWRGPKDKQAGEMEERAEMENASVLSRRAVGEVYMNKAELESCLVVLAGEMGFLRPLVSDTAAVLSADGRHTGRAGGCPAASRAGPGAAAA